jgi:hypothetical protein
MISQPGRFILDAMGTVGAGLRDGRLVAAMAVAALLKTALILTTHGTIDAAMWDCAARQIRSQGGESVYRARVPLFRDGKYQHAELFNHPPFMVHALGFLGWVEETAGIRPSTAVRIADTVADAGSVALAASMLPSPGLIVAALAPLQILISGFHSNTDPAFMFFVVLSVYFAQVRRSARLSGIAMGAALCIKVVPLIVLPVMLLWFGRWRERAVFSAAAGALWLAASLPWLLMVPEQIAQNVFGYKSWYGWWGVSYFLTTLGSSTAGNLFEQYGRFLSLCAVAASAAAIHWLRPETSLFVRCGFAFFAFLLVTPGFGVQYLTWLTPWLAAIGWRLGVLHALAAGGFAALLYIDWTPGRVRSFIDAILMGRTSGFVPVLNVLTWITVALVVWAFSRQLLRRRRPGATGAAAACACALVVLPAASAQVRWTHLSSARGELPNPGGSHQQTGSLPADFDRDGTADIVISYRVRGPALVWIRRAGNGWSRTVIENEFLRLEAGGAAHDIDRDGDLDIVFGGDGGDNHLWWWENPYPRFDPEASWRRRAIKNSGANQQHDQVFADFLGEGRPQLVFWNQRAKTLFLGRIPEDPRATQGPWPLETVFSGQAGEGLAGAAAYAEGVDAFDVDGDKRVDLLAGNYWFYRERGVFHQVKIGSIGGRIRAGRFTPGKAAQVVIAPGDGSGPLRLYECAGNPRDPACWTGRDLLDRDMVHGHTLEVGDIDGDGRLDIFAAEMAKWTTQPIEKDHSSATAWILYGDGKGGFQRTVLVTGDGWHEGKLADVDGDGDLDIVNKPYTWSAPRLDFWLNNGTQPRRRPGR